MIILFEGNENTGKTNISKAISEELTIPYFKNKCELNDLFFVEKIDLEEEIKFVWRFLISFIEQTKTNVIFDRSFITEYVYGNVLRKENFEKKNILNYIKAYDDILSKMDCFLIYCYKTSPFEKDNYIDEKIMPEINQYYKKYLDFTKIHHLKLDTTDNNLQIQLKKIKQFIYGKNIF